MIRRSFLPLLALPLLVRPGLAHDLFTGARDPVDGSRCCNGHESGVTGDCRWFDPQPGEVAVIEGRGVHVRMGRDRIVWFNPLSTLSEINELVPEARVQDSPTGMWGICPRGSLFKGSAVRCLFRPASGS